MPARANRSPAAKAIEVPDLLTYYEVAEHLGVSYWTVRRLVAAGNLRCVLVSMRSPRVTADEVLRYVQERAGLVRESSARDA